MSCTWATQYMALIGTFLKLPMFSDAATGYQMGDKERFPTFVRMMPSYNSFGIGFKELLESFNWRRFYLFGIQDNICGLSVNIVNKVCKELKCVIMGSYRFDQNLSNREVDFMLDLIQPRARIIIFCGTHENKDTFPLRAQERGLMAPEYLYIMTTYIPTTSANPSLNGGNTTRAVLLQRAGSSSIQFSTVFYGEDSDKFREIHRRRLHGPPWNLNFTLPTADLALYSFDSVWLYILAVNKTLELNKDPRNGTALFQLATTLSFYGKTGKVNLNENADRLPEYHLNSAKEGWNKPLIFASILTSEPKGKRFRILDNRMWDNYGGKPPPDTPVCGFINEKCTTNNDNIIISVSLVVAFVVLIIVAILFRFRLKHIEWLKKRWEINSDDITFLQPELTRSTVSGQTRPVSRSKSHDSRTTGHHTIKGIYNGQKVAIKMTQNKLLIFNQQDNLELNLISELIHDNVNRFYGLCSRVDAVFSVSDYAQKGSLQDLIQSDEITIDESFQNCLIHDLLKGIKYIHESPVKSHGKLKSSNCLISSRFILKISDTDPSCVQRVSHHDDEDDEFRAMLWTAPEHLRATPRTTRGSQPGDIYSLGIILQEITTMSKAYFYDELSLKALDIINRVKAGTHPFYRPAIRDHTEIPDMYRNLMQECWQEMPEVRPKIKIIYSSMHKIKSENLADVILTKLEKYSSNLEVIVAKRSEEIIFMKKEAEKILHMILPKSVANLLIAGKEVLPETFDSVTIFFSDICNYIDLCRSRPPRDCVTLLNGLYAVMDSIVSKFNIYKVETIDDTYMVSSGLPSPNENHALDVADFSLTLMSKISECCANGTFDSQLYLRIGIYSGPCCSGIVGLSMPRYCLFGNTVNMASRMCSSSEEMKIQVGQPTYEILRRSSFAVYNMKSRGSVFIKGRGLMQTFWLLGYDDAIEDCT